MQARGAESVVRARRALACKLQDRANRHHLPQRPPAAMLLASEEPLSPPVQQMEQTRV